MTAAEINPSARERFQSNRENIDAHHELLASTAFQRAEDFAWLHYNRVLASGLALPENPQRAPKNPQQEAMINGFKLLGVQEFLHEFRMLAEKPIEVLPPGRVRTLNHNA